MRFARRRQRVVRREAIPSIVLIARGGPNVLGVLALRLLCERLGLFV